MTVTKLKVIAVTVLISVFSWLVEYGYMQFSYTPGLMERMTGEFAAQITKLDDAVSQKIHNGYFQKFLIIESISRDHILALRKIYPAIREGMVFNANRHLMSSTVSHFPLNEIVPLLDVAAETKQPVDFISTIGYQRIYPIHSNGGKRPEGYVSFIVGLPELAGDSVSFAAGSSRSIVYLNSKTPLSEGERAYFQEKLISISMTSGNHATIRLEKKWDIYWVFDPNRMIYFGSLRPAPPLYAYLSFYITFLNLLYAISFFMKNRKPENEHLTILEESLRKNRETLMALRENFSGLTETPNYLNYLDLEREKVVSGTSLEGLSEGGYGPATYGVSGVPFPKMDFILLNPLEEKWIEPLIQDTKEAEGLRQVADELRDRVFSEELKELMDEVEHPPETGIEETIEKIRNFEKEFAATDLNEFAESLRQIYSGDIVGEEIEVPLMHLGKMIAADGMMLMQYDKNHGCYSVYANAGVSDEWQKSFYLLRNDAILPYDNRDGNLIEIGEEIKEHQFFKKRIPAGDIDSLAGLRIIPMQKYNVLACLVAVYNEGPLTQPGPLSEGLEEAVSENAERVFQKSIEEISPLVRKLQAISQGYHATDHYKEAIQELKTVIEGGAEQVRVIHAELEKPLSVDSYSHVEYLCRKFLKPEERLLLIHPRHLVFYLLTSGQKEAEKALDELEQEIRWRSYRFPDDGRNFLYYL